MKHIFGTDAHGRDLFIRVIYGTKVSLLVGIVASVINFTIGVAYGGFAGYMGGKIDNLMMRIVDIMSTIPLTLYVILLMVWMPESRGMKSIFDCNRNNLLDWNGSYCSWSNLFSKRAGICNGGKSLRSFRK